MSIDDPYTVLKYILQNNTSIASLLSVCEGTTIPLVAYAKLEENETGLPCILVVPETTSPENFLNDDTFLANCYASTKRESYLLARTVVKQLNQCDNGAEGYQARTTAKILASVPDPQDKETNTPVEIRIVNIFN